MAYLWMAEHMRWRFGQSLELHEAEADGGVHSNGRLNLGVSAGLGSALVCALPYWASQYITPSFSRVYRKMRHMDRIDWDSRWGLSHPSPCRCSMDL